MPQYTRNIQDKGKIPKIDLMMMGAQIYMTGRLLEQNISSQKKIKLYMFVTMYASDFGIY